MGGMVTGIYQMSTASRNAGEAHEANDYDLFSAQRAASVGQLEAQQKGSFEAGKLRMLGSQMIAKQHTAYANSGVDPTTGTAASVMADTRLMSEADARMAENNAAREVRGFKFQSEAAKLKWGMKNKEIDQAKEASMIGGAASTVGAFLSGGLSLAGG
jgi:hypothetical protein